MKKNIIITFIIFGIIITVGLCYSLIVNSYIKNLVKNKIYELNEMTINDDFNNIDCILILGAGVRANGNPSPMLEDRLKVGIELYFLLENVPIIVSGDHGNKEYDEVNTMKNYLINKGIPSEKIFMDHAGFSTYESIYRAKKIFGVKNTIIVTQKYHLFRALFIAQKLNVNALGISSSLQDYSGQAYFNFREYFARNKDFIKTIIKPKPTYLGNTISLKESGDITNDH